MHVRTLCAAATLAVTLAGTAALAPAGAAPAPHAPSAKPGVFTVTASVDKTEPLLGQKVKITGHVRPAVPGAQVDLQVRYDGRKGWKTIGHDRLNAAGKFRLTDKAGSVRERRYRVVKPAGGHRAAGRATTEKVTVFGWRTLDSLKPVLSQGVYEAGSSTMNAVSYPDSLKGSLSGGHIDYNLNRDCKQLDAVYGIDDGSPASATASLSVVADGVQRHAGVYALTQAQRVLTDVTGVFRLTINAAQTGNGVPAVGTPKVLCSF